MNINFLISLRQYKKKTLSLYNYNLSVRNFPTRSGLVTCSLFNLFYHLNLIIALFKSE